MNEGEKKVKQENILKSDLYDISNTIMNPKMFVFLDTDIKDLILKHINDYKELEKLKNDLIKKFINK